MSFAKEQFAKVKKCRTCNEEKPIFDFRFLSNGYYQGDCKKCRGVYIKKYWAKRGTKAWRPYLEKRRGKFNGVFAKNREKNPIKSYVTQLFNNAKTRSKQRNWEFDLTREWVEERLNKGLCAVSNLPFVFNRPTGTKTKNPFAPSIDRKDNSRGYTRENCQIVMSWYNMAKADHTEEEILRLMIAVVEYKKITSSRGN
jgi:hypothetical protein